jgi:hypothetical protein
LAAADHDSFEPAVPLECLEQEALGRTEISPFSEPELDRITIAVNGTVEIPPLTTDSDICLVHMPLPCDGLLAPIELLEHERGIVNRPAMDGSVIDGDVALSPSSLFKVSEPQIVGEIPPHTEQNHEPVKMPAFEHRALPPEILNAVFETLQQNIDDKTRLGRCGIIAGANMVNDLLIRLI